MQSGTGASSVIEMLRAAVTASVAAAE